MSFGLGWGQGREAKGGPRGPLRRATGSRVLASCQTAGSAAPSPESSHPSLSAAPPPSPHPPLPSISPSSPHHTLQHPWPESLCWVPLAFILDHPVLCPPSPDPGPR